MVCSVSVLLGKTHARPLRSSQIYQSCLITVRETAGPRLPPQEKEQGHAERNGGGVRSEKAPAHNLAAVPPAHASVRRSSGCGNGA